MTEKQFSLPDTAAQNTAAPKTCRGRRNPPGVPNRHTVQKSVRFPPALFEEIEAVRTELGQSIHVFCKESLTVYFEYLNSGNRSKAAEAILGRDDLSRNGPPTGNQKAGIRRTIQFSPQISEKAAYWSSTLNVPVSLMTVEACQRRVKYLKSRVLK